MEDDVAQKHVRLSLNLMHALLKLGEFEKCLDASPDEIPAKYFTDEQMRKKQFRIFEAALGKGDLKFVHERIDKMVNSLDEEKKQRLGQEELGAVDFVDGADTKQKKNTNRTIPLS